MDTPRSALRELFRSTSPQDDFDLVTWDDLTEEEQDGLEASHSEVELFRLFDRPMTKLHIVPVP